MSCLPDEPSPPWPSPLTLCLPDSELKGLARVDGAGLIELSSALVYWSSPSQRQPQPGWIWPLRLQWSGLADWQGEGLLQGRIASAELLQDGRALTLLLPGHWQGRLSLALELGHGARLRLQATDLRITLDGAQLRESLAC